MKNLSVGEKVYIQSYKHDGSLHRTWVKALIIENNNDVTVAVTDQSFVVESDGRKWITKEPAICFFYEKCWYNIISMIRKSGVYYYCNIASPSLYDGEAIKNIDYDLDVKVYPDNSYIILDEYEYECHSRQMNYSQEIKDIIKKEMGRLLEKIKNKEKPFDYHTIDEYLTIYSQIRLND